MKPSADDLPFMSFAVSEWIAATVDLSSEAYAALHRLYCQCWRRAGKLPHDAAALARMVGLSAQEWSRVWPQIQAWFEPTEDGTLTIPTLEVERHNALELRSKRRFGASVTNRKRSRRHTESDTQSDTQSDTVSDTECDTVTDTLTDAPSDSLSETQCGSLKGRNSPLNSPSPPHSLQNLGKNRHRRLEQQTPVPEIFPLTEPMRQEALEQYPDCDVDTWFEQFKAYHRAHGTLMSSWTAAWTSWVANGARFNYPKRKDVARYD